MNLRTTVREHRLATTVVAALAPLATAALLSLVRDSVTAATAVLVLVAVVVAACATGVRAAGLAATLSAVAWFDFFLTEPYNSFTINDANDVEAAVLLLVIGGIVTETALWGLRQEAALSRQTGYLGGVLATAETLAAHHESRDEVTQAVAQRIVEVLTSTPAASSQAHAPPRGRPPWNRTARSCATGTTSTSSVTASPSTPRWCCRCAPEARCGALRPHRGVPRRTSERRAAKGGLSPGRPGCSLAERRGPPGGGGRRLSSGIMACC